MTVKERLIEFLAYKKIGQKKFAETVSLSAGYVNAIRNSIQPDKIAKIAKEYPELNTGWLLTGEGEMLKQDTPSLGSGIPVYTGFGDLTVMGHINLASIDKNAVIIPYYGNSMSPTIKDGDYLAVKENRDNFILWGHIYLILTSSGSAIVRKLHKNPSDPDIVILRSENPDYDEFSIAMSDIQRLFVVDSVISIKKLI